MQEIQQKMAKINNLRASYKTYVEIEEEPVDFKTYLTIAAKYLQFLSLKVLEGFSVTLPLRMGILTIEGKKASVKRDTEGKLKGLSPDWVKTKKLWEQDANAKEEKKIVYHLNTQTDGYIYAFRWSKKNVIVEFKSLYSLVMVRSNKRAVSKQLKKEVVFKTR